MTRIVVVDDHPLLRKGLVLSLEVETDLTVCGQASNAEDALSVVEAENPDLVLVDISLPGMSGL
jgi:YesN/AraC family two-component response regulator